MWTRYLPGFVKVAEYGSFSKAANALFISANALMKQMNYLERALGIKLLNRTNHGISLTRAGDALLEEARPLIAESQRIANKVRHIGEEAIGIVRIASSQLFSPKLVFDWWRDIREEHPSIRLQLAPIPDDIRYWPKLYHEIGSSFDVVVGAKPTPSWDFFDELQIIDLYNIPIVCGIPQSHPFYSRKRISFADLRDEQVYLTREGATPSVDNLRNHLRQNYPSIKLIDTEPYDMPSINKTASDNKLFFTNKLFAEIHPELSYAEFDEDWFLTISLITSSKHNSAVEEFIDAICSYTHK